MCANEVVDCMETYDFFANAGAHLERFEIVFKYSSLSTDEFEMSGFEVYYSNTILCEERYYVY